MQDLGETNQQYTHVMLMGLAAVIIRAGLSHVACMEPRAEAFFCLHRSLSVTS
jgi:hypothetical protein